MQINEVQFTICVLIQWQSMKIFAHSTRHFLFTCTLLIATHCNTTSVVVLCSFFFVCFIVIIVSPAGPVYPVLSTSRLCSIFYGSAHCLTGITNKIDTRVTACDFWHAEYFIRWRQLCDLTPVASGFRFCGCRCLSVS